MLKYLIPLLFLLISPIAHAEKYDRDYRNNALGGIISETEKRIEQMANDERIRKSISGATLSAEAKSPGTREIEIKKNYPVVPYDPNHPNVQKQKSSKFNVSAKAKTLAGRFGRGLNALALGAAVAELIGEGIDWILDPENNSVRYNTPDGYMWQSTVFDGNSLYPTPQLAAQGNCRAYSGCTGVARLHKLSDDSYQVFVRTHNIDQTPAWTVDRVKVDKEQSIPLGTVAQHVINNETYTGDTNITNNYYYYDAVNDTIAEQVENGEHDEDIKEAVKRLTDDKDDTDKADDKEEPDGKTETDTETDEKVTKPDGGFKLPEFCEWAKWFCEDDTPKKQDGEVDIEESDVPQNSVNINFGGACPAPQSFGFSIAGHPMAFVLSYDPICRIAIAFGGIVKVLSTIVAVYILAGAK